MIFEFIYIALLLVFGVVALSSLRLKGWGLLPFGFLVGLGFYIALAHLQVGLGVNSSPLITLSVMAVLVFVAAIYLRKSFNFNKNIVKKIGLTGFLLFLIVSVFWFSNLTKYHYDSFRYLMTSNLIADDELDSISSNLSSKRLSAVSVMHAPAHAYDEYYVRSITPIISLALLAALVWLAVRISNQNKPSSALRLTLLLGVLLLVTNRSYVWHSFYLNGHLLFGFFALSALGAGILLARNQSESSKSSYALLLVQVIGLAGLALSRQEGPLLALLIIAPTTLLSVASRKKLSLVETAAPLLCLGLAILLKQAVLAQGLLSLKGRFVWPDYKITALGLAMAISPALLLWRKLYVFINKHAKGLLHLSEVGLWVALFGLIFLQTDLALPSLSATWENVFNGSGGWGLSLVFAWLALLAATIVLSRQKNANIQLSYLLYPATAFIPLGLMLAHLRGMAFRVGATDSLNRMWVQILPIAILCIVVAMLVIVSKSRTNKG